MRRRGARGLAGADAPRAATPIKVCTAHSLGGGPSFIAKDIVDARYAIEMPK